MIKLIEYRGGVHEYGLLAPVWMLLSFLYGLDLPTALKCLETLNVAGFKRLMVNMVKLQAEGELESLSQHG